MAAEASCGGGGGDDNGDKRNAFNCNFNTNIYHISKIINTSIYYQPQEKYATCFNTNNTDTPIYKF